MACIPLETCHSPVRMRRGGERLLLPSFSDHSYYPASSFPDSIRRTQAPGWNGNPRSQLGSYFPRPCQKPPRVCRVLAGRWAQREGISGARSAQAQQKHTACKCSACALCTARGSIQLAWKLVLEFRDSQSQFWRLRPFEHHGNLSPLHVTRTGNLTSHLPILIHILDGVSKDPLEVESSDFMWQPGVHRGWVPGAVWRKFPEQAYRYTTKGR